ncbi:hypothetical protein FE782_09105 [Paenibacillus antri]|uniref:Nucleoside hydrolase n=1 Tax=Paenibacillus antri TaxID=2582848 RepID=A0A5R9GAM6_9BACL|nr:hypothetical protein [Paenibacillus antri]TLS52771.1 hypothetical protein FE782_09105 [Paenibacillus antri]
MKFAFDVPKSKKMRLIVNTDSKNEADDQFAIVHALLTPRFDIRGIIAAQFEHNAILQGRPPGTMQQSYDEVEKLLELMDCRTSIAELKARVQPCGAIGDYLYQQLIDFNDWVAERNPNAPWPKGEMWALGDSPAVSLLLDDHEYGYEWKPAPRIDADTLHYIHHQKDRLIRVYHYVDPRFTLEDMFAKLALHFG